MSIEMCVEELYGDTLDEHCKQEEIARLKAEQGIQSIGNEPAVSLEAGNFAVEVNEEDPDEGKSGKTDVQHEQGGISGTAENSKGTGSNGNIRS